LIKFIFVFNNQHLYSLTSYYLKFNPIKNIHIINL